MSQSIITKYLPATNTLNSRIKATSWKGSVTISYPYELSGTEAHQKAAQELLDEKHVDIPFKIVKSAVLPDDNGHVFIIERGLNND